MSVTHSQGAGMAEGGLQRLVIAVLEGLCRQMWGFAPRMMALVVAELGPLRALVWNVHNMSRYMRTLHVLGPLRTHLVCMVVSLVNGCEYCAFGQGYAVELVYLKERGVVFPVDARTMCGWIGLSRAELRERLVDLLQRADLHAEVMWLDRTLALAAGEQPATDRAEVRIQHLTRMVGTLNAIATAGSAEPDEAHDTLNKDRDLKARNAALRQSAA